MGQYYKPINIDKKEWLYSHKYDNGLKLMEHSYIGNNFVSAVEKLLVAGGQWYKDHIVWAGDYADDEKDGANLYSSVGVEKNEITPDDKELDPKYRYVVNHTKKEYVDLTRVRENEDGFRIHPLPLLTCEGNGRGGGDFRGNSELVGKWARDSISIEETIPDGYAELYTAFREDT